ncbi:hypothetical protein LTR78_003626 [Recurvomyces mirabilis]|uniref:Uncharacterized protein n=1 Tax=Recurvomyces mirabilis TaxID=574656 RepID=A0AAE0WR87_9PEZI|nr:hypothetical protein LTR78_003626 [Recurvomyces mirabilis]KAK5154740.1 hypothetical protein LTS14_006319 [Recurvomyces mirabilis]
MDLLRSLAAVVVLTASLTSALPHPTEKPTVIHPDFSHTTMTERPTVSHPDFSHTTTYSHVTAAPGWVMPPPPVARAEGSGPVFDSSLSHPLGTATSTGCKTLFYLGHPTVMCDSVLSTAHTTTTKHYTPPGCILPDGDCSGTLTTIYRPTATSKVSESQAPEIGTLATYGPPSGVHTFSLPGFSLPSVPVTVTKAPEHSTTTVVPNDKRATSTRCTEKLKVYETLTYVGPSTTQTFTHTIDVMTETFTIPGTTFEVTQSLLERRTDTTHSPEPLQTE